MQYKDAHLYNQRFAAAKISFDAQSLASQTL